MNLLIHSLLIFILVILQISFFSQISFWGGSLNIILVILLSLLYIDRQKEAFYWVIIGGILLDLVSPLRFGIYLFLSLLVYILNHFLIRRFIFRKNLYIIFFMIFFSSIIYESWFLLWDRSLIAAKIILISALINSLIGLFIKYWIDYYYQQKEEVKI